MEETKTFKGLWWLPDNASNKVPGTLIIEKSRIVFETIGSLSTDNPINRCVKESNLKLNMMSYGDYHRKRQ